MQRQKSLTPLTIVSQNESEKFTVKLKFHTLEHFILLIFKMILRQYLHTETLFSQFLIPTFSRLTTS